jgi:hypothetical protein
LRAPASLSAQETIPFGGAPQITAIQDSDLCRSFDTPDPIIPCRGVNGFSIWQRSQIPQQSRYSFGLGALVILLKEQAHGIKCRFRGQCFHQSSIMALCDEALHLSRRFLSFRRGPPPKFLCRSPESS